jgi:drug/metabolite transporter (DMT)-like permease
MPRAVMAALLTQTLISAGTFLAAKRAMEELPPFTLVLWRFLVASPTYALLLLAMRGGVLPPKGARGKVLLLGLLAGPVNQGLFFHGLSLSSAAHGALLYATTPLVVYVLSVARGRERASTRALLGIVTAFAGVVVLLLGGGLAQARGSLVGDLFILAAVTAWALYTTEAKAFSVAHGAVRTTGWSMVAAGLLLVPAMPLALRPSQALAASAVTWGCIVFLGLLTSFVAYLLWNYALSRAEASRVAVFSNLQPPFTALAAWAVLGEPLRWEMAVGGALVLAGVRMTQRA